MGLAGFITIFGHPSAMISLISLLTYMAYVNSYTRDRMPEDINIGGILKRNARLLAK